MATLTINNDAGRDYARGVKQRSVQVGYDVVRQESFEPTDTEVSNQLNAIRASNAGGLATLVTGATEIAMLKYRRQTSMSDPTFIYSGAASIKSFLEPAGSAATGIYSALWLKDPADPQWATDASLDRYRSTVAKYGKGVDANDIIVANGYGLAEALVAALESADELTTDGLLQAWDHLPATQLDVLLPGIELKGNAVTGRPVQAYQVAQYDGRSWQKQGEVVGRSGLGG
ncbi:ABC transporter substrate-binding protein [Nocardia sp. NPDC006982]|uniref:ABC transporter substrate-binding protein n=1 Tax=Nocardia sp. NPDC006982 TaxID=3364307 RepID=UPI00369D6FB4